MIYNNFEELQADDPPAVIGSEYLERPDGGWREIEGGFIGIGYHGNEGGYWKDGTWETCKSGLGHVPTNGYG